ncbi:MAG: type I restriction enzyme HsdR N-terminal domain-containing protein [Rhodothermales bacterium]|nr:type I restriction enzyme HsdR N-terminal domain-containing protein [Rhodothermales bacterium]
MPPLNFPPTAPFDVRDPGAGERPLVLDEVRRKYVALTPEEWVRQHLVRYLRDGLGYPAGLLAVEKKIGARGGPRRADLVAYGRAAGGEPRPVLIAECKAPAVRIAQAVFDQVSRYNTVAQAPHLVVTNGLAHYCWTVDRAAGTYRFLDQIPPYAALAQQP